MLYLGIDQHARQLTISLRNEAGDTVLARQVSTESEKINAFFEYLTRERLGSDESFVAVLEVCGFNDWLIRMLRDYRCHKVILIQPEERKKQKTDRRDAAALSELCGSTGNACWQASQSVAYGRSIYLPQPIKKTDASLHSARMPAAHGLV